MNRIFFIFATAVLALIVLPLLPAGAEEKTVTADMVANDLRSRITFPMQVDELTYLTDVSADGNTIVYTLTVSVKVSEIEPQLGTLQEEMQSMCAEPDYLTVLRKGMSVRLVYRDNDGGSLPPLQISPSDCKL